MQAGTIIPAVLLTAINSDLPGPVIAQVRENVYDTVSGNTCSCPRARACSPTTTRWSPGARTASSSAGGACSSRTATRSTCSARPPPISQGAAGLTDDVDEHWVRLIAGAGVSSLLAASATAAAGNQTSFAPTVPQLWATNAAQSVNQTGQQIVGRDLQVQPTITVRPGFSVNVIVHKDIAPAALPGRRDVPGRARRATTSSPSQP